ncbi:MAG: hypothetical protein HY302_00410 [Opitutae bacterium]|nr:hypothetical protein [Opitutae bacterium]
MICRGGSEAGPGGSRSRRAGRGRADFLRGRAGESGLERGEEFDLGGEEEVEVAAEVSGGGLENVAGGFAHFHERAEVAGKEVDVAVGEFKADELGERGLVERVGGKGAGEQHPGLVADADSREAIGDGDEVIGTEVRLGEEVIEEKAGLVGLAEPVERDGLEAVEDGGELFGPFGRGAGVSGDQIQGGPIFAGDDVGFGDHEGGTFDGRVERAGEVIDAGGEGGAAGVGGELGEGEQGGGFAGEIAQVGFDFLAQAGGVAALVVEIEELEARGVGEGIEGEPLDGVFLEGREVAAFAVELAQLDVDRLGVGGVLQMGLEANDRDVGITAFPVEARLQDHTVGRLAQTVGRDQVLGLVVIAAEKRNRGGEVSHEPPVFGGPGGRAQQVVRHGLEFGVLFKIEEKSKEVAEVGAVALQVGQASEENVLREVRPAAGEIELRQ